MLFALLPLAATAAEPRLDVDAVALPRVEAAQATPVRSFLVPFSTDWNDDVVERCADGEDVADRLPLAVAALEVRPGAPMTVWGVHAGTIGPDGQVAQGEARGRLILPLYDRLLDLTQATRALAATGCPPWHREDMTFEAHFLVIADRRLPASTLDRIQFTVGEAGFEEIHLLVDARRTVDPPDASDPADFTFVDAGPEEPLGSAATRIARVRHGGEAARTVRLRLIGAEDAAEQGPAPHAPASKHAWTVADAVPTLEIHLGRPRQAPRKESDEADVILHEDDVIESGQFFGDTSTIGPSVTPGDPIILGALDRSLIHRVMRRHLGVFRSCYQRELQLDPLLQGTLVVKFIISKDGSVARASVKSSTLGNERLESCVTERLLRVQFPSPKGGGIVIVRYPLVFRPH